MHFNNMLSFRAHVTRTVLGMVDAATEDVSVPMDGKEARVISPLQVAQIDVLVTEFAVIKTFVTVKKAILVLIAAKVHPSRFAAHETVWVTVSVMKMADVSALEILRVSTVLFPHLVVPITVLVMVNVWLSDKVCLEGTRRSVFVSRATMERIAASL